jgi:sirohydrochlorin cobaltochelatase
MNAVVLFAHGSLLCGAGEALKAHAERLRARGIAPIVDIGYLNYSEPRFAEAVAACAAQGATRIVVQPYFLVPGKFVRTDLPAAVAAAQTAFPNLAFVIAEAIGYDEMLADALIESARKAAPPECWGDDLERAAQFCRASAQCPLYGTSACPGTAVS